VEAFSNVLLVPWMLRNDWENCFHLFSQISFHVSHIFREENHCVDIPVNYSFTNVDDHWWCHVPHLISKDFFLKIVHLCLILGSRDFLCWVLPSPLKLYLLFLIYLIILSGGADDFIVRHGVPTMPT